MTNHISSPEMERMGLSLQKRLVPWEQTTPQERAVLLDVERDLLTMLPQQRAKAARRPMVLAFGAMTSFCALLLVWLSWPQSEALTPLHFAGGWRQAQPAVAKARPSTVVREQVLQTQTEEGSIEQGRVWQLRAKRQTALRVKRRHNRNTEVELSNGHIRVHVKPQTMERFAVFCKGGVQVLVRGTVFSVEQREDWLRVEVTRGKVLVQRGGQSYGVLKAGQGQRVDLQSNEVQRYPLPHAESQTPLQKVAWYAKHAPTALFQYTLDRVSDPSVESSVRDALFRRTHSALRHLAKMPKGRAYSHQAYALLLAEYRSNPPHGAAELSLLSAMQMCRNLFAQNAQCLRWYRHYLKRYKHGMQQEQVLYWLAEALSKRGESGRSEAKALIDQYLQSHQKGDSYYAHFLALKRGL